MIVETSSFLKTPLIRQISSNVSDQSDKPTCWGFSVARVILKFIKSILPELQTLSTDRTTCNKYYNIDKFTSNLTKKKFFFKQKNLPDIFKSISSKKCGEKEYKNLCLFMFIYYQLTNEFGCDGQFVFVAMRWFTDNFLNKHMHYIGNELIYNLLPEPYNSVAINLMFKFYTIKRPKIFANNLNYNSYRGIKEMIILSNNGVVPLLYHTDNDDNFMFNLVKNIIDTNLYLTIGMDLLGDGTDNFIFYSNNTPRPKYSGCKIKDEYDTSLGIWKKDVSNAGMHAMTIINYIDSPNPNDRSFVIKNSWGSEWGINGTITIPINEIKTHCSLTITYLSFIDLITIVQEIQGNHEVKGSLNNIIELIEIQDENNTANKGGSIKNKKKRKKRRINKTKKRK